MQLPPPATLLDPLLSPLPGVLLGSVPVQGRHLDALSRALAEAADELAGRRSALGSRAAGLRWHSPAARAFGAVLQELLGQLGHSSSRLAELSAAVRSHRQRAGSVSRLAAAGSERILATVERMVRLP